VTVSLMDWMLNEVDSMIDGVMHVACDFGRSVRTVMGFIPGHS
jgi:hypothetical protein